MKLTAGEGIKLRNMELTVRTRMKEMIKITKYFCQKIWKKKKKISLWNPKGE
jgi:hypothetical protein